MNLFDKLYPGCKVKFIIKSYKYPDEIITFKEFTHCQWQGYYSLGCEECPGHMKFEGDDKEYCVVNTVNGVTNFNIRIANCIDEFIDKEIFEL